MWNISPKQQTTLGAAPLQPLGGMFGRIGAISNNLQPTTPNFLLDQKGQPITDPRTGQGIMANGQLAALGQNQSQNNMMTSKVFAQPRSDYSGYLSGTDTKPLNAREVADLYGRVANGSLTIAPDQFSRLLQSNSDTKGIDTSEWGSFSPEYRAWAQANPQAWMADALAHRNSANHDLGSMGAEGGYANPAGIRPGGDYSNAGYMDIHDEGPFGGGLLGALAPIALGIALGPAGLGLSGIGGGALAGGLTSAIGGGNILKGAALGGLGGGISNFAGSNFSSLPSEGFAGISPAQFANTAGRTGLSILGGQDPSKALLGGVGGLAGTSAASNFDNPWLKNLAGATASTAVRGGDIGNAALNSLFGTTAKYGASQTDNPFLKDLALSSPQLLGQLMGNSQPQAQPRPQTTQPTMQQAQGSQMPNWVKQAMVALGKKGYSEQQAMQMVQQRGRGA